MTIHQIQCKIKYKINFVQIKKKIKIKQDINIKMIME